MTPDLSNVDYRELTNQELEAELRERYSDNPSGTAPNTPTSDDESPAEVPPQEDVTYRYFS